MPQVANRPEGEHDWGQQSSLGYAQRVLNARLKPYLEAGNQTGFEVKSVTDESPLKEVGIEDGDIIKSINGEPIDSDLDILLIHDAIIKGDLYALSIVRDGKPLTLSGKPKTGGKS